MILPDLSSRSAVLLGHFIFAERVHWSEMRRRNKKMASIISPRGMSARLVSLPNIEILLANPQLDSSAPAALRKGMKCGGSLGCAQAATTQKKTSRAAARNLKMSSPTVSKMRDDS